MAALVLLPGMDGTGALFDYFVRALRPGVGTIVVSYPADQPLDYAQHEAIARAKLPSDQPFVMLGESFSGPIAVAIAASAPRNLRGLILCCSFVKNPRPAISPAAAIVNILPLGAMPSRLVNGALLGRFSSPDLRRAVAATLAAVSPAVLRARLRAVLGVDVSGLLPAVRVPVLYLRAGHDWIVPRASSRLIGRLLPTVRIVEIPAPHALLQAVPAEAARHVESFVTEVVADAPVTAPRPRR